MGKWVTVRRDETLSKLGAQAKIPWKKIWDHPENAELKRRRGNPNILHVGDNVFVPDLERHEEACATEKRHRFRTGSRMSLRVCLVDSAHAPLVGIAYSFTVDGERMPEETTGDDGVAETPVREDAEHAVLHLPWGDVSVQVGVLSPANTVRGVQERLQNLGINPGPIDGIFGPLTAAGIRDFQRCEGMPISGVIDEALVRRLRSVHENETLDAECERPEDPVPPPARASALKVAEVPEWLLEEPEFEHGPQHPIDHTFVSIAPESEGWDEEPAEEPADEDGEEVEP
ncbi:MAG: peptidoglycan-binding domain-containing protein [Phycisphaerales bacterium]